MQQLQELIHAIEVRGGKRFLHWALFAVLVALLIVVYNFRCFRNFSTPEAMDSAQLARSLAQGKGFSTLFIRPFSLYLIKKHNALSSTQAAPRDPMQLKENHPDLANAPLYPLALAGLMKVMPFRYDANRPGNGFWTNGGRCWRYQPDFLISFFNQLLFLGVVLLSYLVARRLFDNTVAWLSALVILGTDLFWRFSASGLSTMLAMLLFVGLVWTLVIFEEEGREPAGGPWRSLMLGLGMGLLIGAGALTRYSFGWLVAPAMAFALLFGGTRRFCAALAVLLGFLVMLTPWVIRNYSVSGTAFGTAGYAVVEGSGSFAEHPLQSTLEPDLNQPFVSYSWHKLLVNGRQIVEEELPRLGGNWLSAFFLAGLLVQFQQPGIQRLRYFLLGSLGTLILVQALGRTPLSEASPAINSENLLVLTAPVVFIFGVALFYLLLEQLELPLRELRHAVVVVFGLALCLPLIFTLLPPRPTPVAWPPYYPPLPQMVAKYTHDGELTVSDIPWAMAWYGQRQCLWAANPDDLAQINDFQKPVQALYLSSLTLNGRFISEWLPTGQQTWGSLVLQSLQYAAPARKVWQDTGNGYAVKLGLTQTTGSAVTFPLHYWQAGWPDTYVLTARERASGQ